MLPFVDGLPVGPEQTRINWIKNGDFLEGAKTSLTNEGNLNAAGVQLQQNIVYLHGRMELEGTAFGSRLTHLEKIVDESLSLDVVETLNRHTTEIGVLTATQEDHENKITQNRTDIDKHSEILGVPLSPPVRNMTEDLQWVKTEMGNYTDEDINGNPDPDALPTGIKRRVLDNTAQSVQNRNDIANIQQAMNDADLGTLKNNVEDLRDDVGTNTQNKTVFSQLDEHGVLLDAHTQAINKIKLDIGDGDGLTIAERMGNQETAFTELKRIVQAPDTGLVDKVVDLQEQADTTDVKVQEHSVDIESLKTTVGDAESGLVKDMTDVKDKIGFGANPPTDSLEYRFSALQALQNDTSVQLQDLQAELGTSSTGLTGEVRQLQAQLIALTARVETLENAGP